MNPVTICTWLCSALIALRTVRSVSLTLSTGRAFIKLVLHDDRFPVSGLTIVRPHIAPLSHLQ
ncbi:hypothetical protein KC19_VG315700 [Ceratodon purpureus]|uniref:Secreted protein n=1 Tax=Ceratodon purpureus TaxID=3225 RepID=A0A8T0HX86_CERPU|nr:hypothetical protein KC19_VG315700 [Ceratodon purpureus]